jgi:hypothetical protein
MTMRANLFHRPDSEPAVRRRGMPLHPKGWPGRPVALLVIAAMISSSSPLPAVIPAAVSRNPAAFSITSLDPGLHNSGVTASEFASEALCSPEEEFTQPIIPNRILSHLRSDLSRQSAKSETLPPFHFFVRCMRTPNRNRISVKN